MNWADWVILTILLISSLISLKRGFVKEALSMVNWVLAFVVAVTFRDQLSLILVEYISTPSIRDLSALAILFALTLIVGAMVNYLIGELVRMTGLSGTDRFFGVIFGFIRGFIVVMFLLIFLPSLISIEEDSWWQESLLIPTLLKFEDWCLLILAEASRVVSGFFA